MQRLTRKPAAAALCLGVASGCSRAIGARCAVLIAGAGRRAVARPAAQAAARNALLIRLTIYIVATRTLVPRPVAYGRLAFVGRREHHIVDLIVIVDVIVDVVVDPIVVLRRRCIGLGTSLVVVRVVFGLRQLTGCPARIARDLCITGAIPYAVGAAGN